MPHIYLKYLIYFLSGSILITAITLVAEKRSRKIAGILMCLPEYIGKTNTLSDGTKRSIEILSGLLSGFAGYFLCIAVLSQLPITSGWVSLFALWVAAVVVLGDSFGYLWGGLFSSFPGTITPVLVLLHLKNGKSIISGVIKSSPIGLSATGLYSCMVWLLYPMYGIIAGTFASYLAVIGFLSVIFFRSWLK